MKTLNVPIGELRKILDLIFDHIQTDLRIEEVVLNQDYYWEIPSAQRYDMSKAPQNEAGQLYDDWDFLKPMLLRDRKEAVSLMFIHAAPLLRYIGEKVGQ